MKDRLRCRRTVLLLAICAAPAFLSGCPDPQPEATVKTAVIGTNGGSIVFEDARRYSISLTIPSGALRESTEITVTSFPDKLDNPISQNVLPGVAVEPADLLLRKPALLEIAVPDTKSYPSGACLFSIVDTDLVVPLADQALTADPDVLGGKLFHFCTYAAGAPTEPEMVQQIEGILESQAAKSGGCPPVGYGWQGTHKSVQGLLYWSQRLQLAGNDAAAQEGFDAANEVLQQDIESFLEQPVPPDPCGSYLRAASKYMEAAQLLGLSLDGADPMYQRYQQTLDQCAIRFNAEVLEEHRATEPAKEEAKTMGNVTCFVPYTAFLAGETPTIQGNGVLTHNFSYDYKPSPHMLIRETQEASGSVTVTAHGSLLEKSDEFGALSIWAHLVLSFEKDVQGQSCHTDANGVTECGSTSDNSTWVETYDFLLSAGYQEVYTVTDPETGEYMAYKRVVTVTHMPSNSGDDPPGTCY